MRLKTAALALLALASTFAGVTLGGAPASAAPAPAAAQSASVMAQPAFQLPFPCGQSWNGDNDNSSAHRSYEIDFNRGNSGGADEGDTVVAAASGKVTISAHQGSRNGYGNLIKIDHGGWYTYYAHLRVRSVGLGAQVAQGQKIGEVGHTSKPGNNITAHLHYEVRVDGSYPGNIKPAYFNGTRFGYPNQTLTSRNSCDGTSNPYAATDVCEGYSVIDSAKLAGSAGTVYLLYSASSGKNCVATIKGTSLGKASATSAYLEVQGSTRQTDQGEFSYYAGPVSAAASNQCVKWGGSVGNVKYDSDFEHCD